MASIASPSNRHVRQKVGDNKATSPLHPTSGQQDNTCPMPIGVAPERRASTSKAGAKGHSPRSSRSVSPARARAVRSAVGKATIGGDSNADDRSCLSHSSPPRCHGVSIGKPGQHQSGQDAFKLHRGCNAFSSFAAMDSCSSSPVSPCSISGVISKDMSVSPIANAAKLGCKGTGIMNGRSTTADAGRCVKVISNNLNDSSDIESAVIAAPHGPSALQSGQTNPRLTTCEGVVKDGQVQQSEGVELQPPANDINGPGRILNDVPCMPDTLPMKRPAPETATPAKSDSSATLSIGDHISAARAFSGGRGSISSGLAMQPNSASSSTNQGTSTNRTACLDTAASHHQPSYNVTHVSECGPSKGGSPAGAPDLQESPTEAVPELCNLDSADSTLQSLELARLRLTHDHGVGTSAEHAECLSRNSSECDKDSCRGSASDEICLQTTLQPSSEANLTSGLRAVRLMTASSDVGHDVYGITEDVCGEKQQRACAQPQRRRLVRSLSDPSGSREHRRESRSQRKCLHVAIRPAEIMHQKSEQERNLCGKNANQQQQVLEAGIGGEKFSQAAAETSDVGAMLSNRLLLQEDLASLPPAQQQLTSAERLSRIDLETGSNSSNDMLPSLDRSCQSAGVQRSNVCPHSQSPSSATSKQNIPRPLDDAHMQTAPLTEFLQLKHPCEGSMGQESTAPQGTRSQSVSTSLWEVHQSAHEDVQHMSSGSKNGSHNSNVCTTQSSSSKGTLGASGNGVQQQHALAAHLAKESRPKEALELLEPMLLDAPQSAELLQLRGECLAALGNNIGAFASFASALAVVSCHIATRVSTLMSCGRLYKGRGLLAESIESYRKALVLCPQSADIAQSLAVVLTDQGTQLKLAGVPRDALKKYFEAVEICPSYAPALYNVAVVHGEAGRTEAAIVQYKAALAALPAYPEAWCNLGVIYKNQGLLREAIRAYEKALTGAPNFSIVRSNLAIALTELATVIKSEGDLQGSIEMYDRALAYNSRNPDALYNLGVACGEAGLVNRAFFAYEMAASLNPTCAEALNNMGVLYRESGNLKRAMQCYIAALQVRPNFPQGLNNLAVIYTVQGRVAEALQLLQGALLAAPTYVEAHNNLGVLYRDIGSIPDAIRCYDRCIELCPNTRNAGQNRLLALNYIFQGEDRLVCAAHEEWGARFQSLFPQTAASSLRPNSCWTRAESSPNASSATCTSPNNMQQTAGNMQAPLPSQHLSSSSLQEALPVKSEFALDHSIVGESGIGPQHHRQCAASCSSLAMSPSTKNACKDDGTAHLEQCAAAAAAAAVTPAKESTASKHRLTVGYLSADLFTHSVSYFAEAPLSHHDAAVVRVIVYSCVAKGDAKTAKLEAAVQVAGGTWRDVAAMTETQLAFAVQSDKVDVLVELAGHTANNRLGVMAMRPAPVQVTWIGYPNSTGLQAVKYRITDAVCDPSNTRQTFVEELVRLPGCFLCYTPADDAPPVSPSPAAAAGFVTFGSFNNLAKITPQVLQVWSRILHAVPQSRLLLKSKPYACETARNHTLATLQALGIDRIRVDLLPLATSTAEHLSTYSSMDISLDPFPYAGTTTTCESIYMGVPCVTLAGGCHAHNVGVSLLTAIGGLTGDWVGHTEDEYVSLAVAAAADIPELAALRAGLRSRMLTSSLADGSTFTKGLEKAYLQMWDRYVATA